MYCLLEQVPGSLQLPPPVPRHKLSQVHEPNIIDMGPLEQRHATLIAPEGLFEEKVLLQVLGIVQDELWGRHLEIKNAIVAGPHCLGGTQGLLQIRIQGPELHGPEQPTVHGLVPGLPSAHGLARHPEGVLVVPVPQLHLNILAPDRRQVIHRLKLHLHSLLEDPPGVLQVVMLLIEPSESNPQGRELAHSLLGVHGHDGLGKRLNHPLGVVLEQSCSLQPLVDVVGILPQQHRGQQLLPPGDQVLASGQQQINLSLVLVLLLPLHRGCHQGVLKLTVGIEDHGEIMYCGHGHHRLLVDITRLLKLTQADKMIRQGVPEPSHLICEFLQSSTNDRLDSK
mmetsp:Transcript_53196/g.116750  ORF Transcript_53196/g.116750 Transcript_53196/m.116750 type:complete len:339 (+) Transcript_53196:961-1977(+)